MVKMIIVAVTITKQHWQKFRAWPLCYLHNWLHLPRHNFHPTHPVLHVEYMGCICLACRTLVHVLHMYRWLKFAVDPWTCTYSCALKTPLSTSLGDKIPIISWKWAKGWGWWPWSSPIIDLRTHSTLRSTRPRLYHQATPNHNCTTSNTEHNCCRLNGVTSSSSGDSLHMILYNV